MNAKILIAGVAIAALAAGGASATMHKKHSVSSAGAYAEPAQPIPYSQLDAYMKASPRERQQILASAATASTGSQADTSASSTSAPASDMATPATPPTADTSATPPAPMTAAPAAPPSDMAAPTPPTPPTSPNGDTTTSPPPK
jgi:hypothetical protein